MRTRSSTIRRSARCTAGAPVERGELLRTDFLLEGVHCAACVWLVERLPLAAPGVVEARLDIRRASVQITFDPARVTLSSIGRTLASLGYPAHPARGAGSAPALARRAEDRRSLIRVAVAGACAGNVMLLFLALYAGMFEEWSVRTSRCSGGSQWG